MSIAEQKPKPFDLDAFKAFVASKPADEQYDASDWSACALAQFGYPLVRLSRIEGLGIPRDVYVTTALEWSNTTFGALADRLANLGQSV